MFLFQYLLLCIVNVNCSFQSNKTNVKSKTKSISIVKLFNSYFEKKEFILVKTSELIYCVMVVLSKPI